MVEPPRFLETGEIISEAPVSESDSFSLSSAISLSEEYSYSVFGEKGESGTEIEPSRLSTAPMRLSEYYVLYEALSRDPSLKILLMDRTVSGDIAHMSWKLRDYIQYGTCVLTGFETKFGRISKTDLELGRMLIENK